MAATSPKPEEKQPKASDLDTIRRELGRVGRQLEGMTKSVKRLSEKLKQVTA